MKEPQHHVDPKAIKVWQIEGTIITVVSALAAAVCSAFAWHEFIPTFIPVILWIIAALLGIALIGIIPVIRWKRCKYEVKEDQIDIQRGWFIIKRTIVPMVRVQHVDTSHGPLLRSYKLASVHISTAATVHEIPALPVEEASELRDQIASLAKVRDDDV